MRCGQVSSTQMCKQGKYYLPRMILGSIKTQQRKNVWESLSDLFRPGRQAVTLTTLPELGQGCFCPRGTWSCRAVSGLLAQRHAAESVSAKELRLSSERESLNCFAENRSGSCAFPLIPACDTERGAGGPGPGPVGTSTERCPETGEHPSVTGCPLALIRCLGVWVTPASTRPVGKED